VQFVREVCIGGGGRAEGVWDGGERGGGGWAAGLRNPALGEIVQGMGTHQGGFTVQIGTDLSHTRYAYKRMQDVLWKEWGKYRSVNSLFGFGVIISGDGFPSRGRGGRGQYSRQMETWKLEYKNNNLKIM
jgi:hypothetical protein